MVKCRSPSPVAVFRLRPSAASVPSPPQNNCHNRHRHGHHNHGDGDGDGDGDDDDALRLFGRRFLALRSAAHLSLSSAMRRLLGPRHRHRHRHRLHCLNPWPSRPRSRIRIRRRRRRRTPRRRSRAPPSHPGLANPNLLTPQSQKLAQATTFRDYLPPQSPKKLQSSLNRLVGHNQDPINPNPDPSNPNQDPSNPNQDPSDPNQDPLDPNQDPSDPNQGPLNPNQDPSDRNQAQSGANHDDDDDYDEIQVLAPANQGVEELLEEAAHYIVSLQRQVQALTNALTSLTNP